MTHISHPIRHITAPGTCNFRDLGGYQTRSGQIVQSGKVFRSGVLDAINPDDLTLVNLGVKVVVDLRTTKERVARPSSVPSEWNAVMWHRDYDSSGGDHSKTPYAMPTEDQLQLMRRIYRRMPFEQARSYTALFRHLADGSVPLLFHCHGGKDRTGVAAAILLDVLEVPRDQIRHDYALTEACLRRDRLVLNAGRDHAHQAPVDNPPPIMRAAPAYIDSMFDKIEQEFGSTSGYLCEALGIDATDQLKIRSNLLTSVAGQSARSRGNQP